MPSDVSLKVKMHQNRFRTGFGPEPIWNSLQRYLVGVEDSRVVGNGEGVPGRLGRLGDLGSVASCTLL